MARIQLRDTTIYLQDGLSGTAAVNDAAGIVDTDVDIDIDTIVLNTDTTDLVPIGARFTIAGGDGTVYTVTARTPTSTAPTTNIVWTPAADASNTVADDGVLTFLPQRLAITIGDGDLTWTEAQEFIYDLDRDLLDTVRQGEDQPVSADLAFTFEEYTASTSNPPTPADVFHRVGEASEWVNSATDPCEPYAVDIYVIHNVPCGATEDQDILLPDFRFESLDYSIRDASVAVSGRCNVTKITSTRAADIS